jgi:hypothetical protein
MTSRRPLVLVSGTFSELPQGDSVAGASVTLAASPSGLIFVGADLGIDGVALASGEAAQVSANTALASGNAALEYIANNPGISEGDVIGLIFALG